MDMRPLNILLAEHRIVEDVLRGLDKAARDFRYLTHLPRQEAGELIWFLRAFVDGCHHAKEERILFPILEANHMHSNMGPTAAMRLDHRLGANLIADMESGLADPGESGRRRFAHAAEAYSSMLRGHIHKEDHCVFALAAALLDAQEKGDLESAFLKIDAEFAAAGEGDGLTRARDVLDMVAAWRNGPSLAGKLPFHPAVPGIQI